nr:hypothetical protein I308_02816 [Cryptococcus tetragattii IND107]
MLEWLEDVFDPYIRGLARDGRDPDSFSSMPRNVDFFAHLKHAYHQQLDDFQIGSGGQKLLKGMHYLWHQHAWAPGGDSEADQECMEEVQLVAA